MWHVHVLWHVACQDKTENRFFNITFFNSLLILPANLDSLCKSFNIKNKKDVFPFPRNATFFEYLKKNYAFLNTKH